MRSDAVELGDPADLIERPRVDVEHLVGAAEIAERLGVKRPQVVHDSRRRHADFPKPVAALRQALVWSWPDVKRWAKKTGRLP